MLKPEERLFRTGKFVLTFGTQPKDRPMKKVLCSLAFGLLMFTSTLSAQNGPMYGGEGLVDILKKVNEVQVNMQGYEYTYNGEWLQTMKLEDGNTVSFTRGRVKHSYDLRKVAMIQDEGRYIKLWLR